MTQKNSPQTILITGAAGGVGTILRPRLAKPGRTLRLLDLEPLSTVDGEESITATVTDLDAMTEACRGADALIHLGGLSLEDDWPSIMDTNINGTYVALEAARRAGVPRVILASSNHAVGYYPNDGETAPDDLFPRPDTYYGVSKVAMEALGSLYSDRYGLDVICLRIGSCFDKPRNARMLASWMSPDDCARLMEAALSTPEPGFQVVWGISANTRGWWSLDGARAIGYEPQDDAEVYAAEVESLVDPYDKLLGGAFCSPSLDAPLPERS
ncbi:NAD(P)-dependent oxidoreductase [Pseudonocardiaceae bacterium YIM PH 21723]|nr:NAD(P)-dependent oxidoreductase [Pseudonocardiaceae bacterium YIM PH 21723]